MKKIKPKRKDLRVFGFIWTVFFLAVALYPMINEGEPRTWALICSGAFFITALLIPDILKWFYIIWVKIGNVIGKINSYIIMFLLFFLIFTPVAIIFKIFGRDPLKRKIRKNKETYWEERKEQPGTMKYQY